MRPQNIWKCQNILQYTSDNGIITILGFLKFLKATVMIHHDSFHLGEFQMCKYLMQIPNSNCKYNVQNSCQTVPILQSIIAVSCVKFFGKNA